MAIEKRNLEKWKFALGEEITCLDTGREIQVPHTWNVEEDTEEYRGTGWYVFSFVPEESWRDKRVRVLFHAVYHDAYVCLNGRKIGVHKNSGYTPFVIELTDNLRMGEENQLAVKVDNSFSEQMLPCGISFDWANDGGLIRPVELLVTGRCFVKNPTITAAPVITLYRERQDEGSAVFGFRAVVDGSAAEDLSMEWTLYDGCDDSLEFVCAGKECVTDGIARIPGRVLPFVKYWHFDRPDLYTLKITLKAGEELLDTESVVFGFREFRIWGREFYLNGEPVRLTGAEWMPGSNPDYGMAEPEEQLEKMLLCLKESGSVLTRFHWQQDEWVYNWCDRHGMLVQEEVPFWGKSQPPKAGEQQWKIFREQMQEMVTFHRNHPSIIFWGVGNELDGQCEENIQYIKDAVAYTHMLDSDRRVNYVSNTIFKGHALDGTTDGDVMMVNDYIGTWHEGYDQYEEWDAIVRQNPDKPVIPSEFGLCEPAFSGGDERRDAIFREKMACYRNYPNIAGTIYFCLNDYRTHMGEDGKGKWKKRVHGSADLYGQPKPSYYTVQKEYSPLILEVEEKMVKIKCRNDLPSYTVRGYSLKWKGQKLTIPDLKPGDIWSFEDTVGVHIDELAVYRPGGERVL